MNTTHTKGVFFAEAQRVPESTMNVAQTPTQRLKKKRERETARARAGDWEGRSRAFESVRERSRAHGARCACACVCLIARESWGGRAAAAHRAGEWHARVG